MPKPQDCITALIFSEEGSITHVILTPLALTHGEEQKIGTLAGSFHCSVDFLPLTEDDLCESMEAILQQIKDNHPGETDDCDPPYNEGEDRYDELNERGQ